MTKGFQAAALILAISLQVTGCSFVTNPEDYEADMSLIPKEAPNGKWGYVDRSGKYLIAPKYDKAWYFTDNIFDKHNGEAFVTFHGKDCFIDKSGWVVSVGGWK